MRSGTRPDLTPEVPTKKGEFPTRNSLNSCTRRDTPATISQSRSNSSPNATATHFARSGVEPQSTSRFFRILRFARAPLPLNRALCCTFRQEEQQPLDGDEHLRMLRHVYARTIHISTSITTPFRRNSFTSSKVSERSALFNPNGDQPLTSVPKRFSTKKCVYFATPATSSLCLPPLGSSSTSGRLT